MGLGAAHEDVGHSAKTALCNRLFARQAEGRPVRFRPGGPRHLGRHFQPRRPRSKSPYHLWRQEGQFLDDGGHRAVRTVLGDPFQPSTGRQRQPGRRVPGPGTRQQRLAPVHRDLEPRFHPVQRQRRRNVFAPGREARRHRHGFRTGCGHPRDDGRLQGLHEGSVQLCRRRLLTAFCEDRRPVGEGVQGHRARQARGTERTGECRHCISRFGRPRPLRIVRDRRRNPPRERGPELRHPAHPPPRHSLRQEARPCDRVLRAARRAGRRIARRHLSRARTAAGHAWKGDPKRGGELWPDARPRPAGLQCLGGGASPGAASACPGSPEGCGGCDRPWLGRRTAVFPGHSSGSRRIRALRHLRLPPGHDPTARGGARAFRRCRRLRTGDGQAEAARPGGPEKGGHRRSHRGRIRGRTGAHPFCRPFRRLAGRDPRNPRRRRPRRQGGVPRFRPDPILCGDGRPAGRPGNRPHRRRGLCDRRRETRGPPS